MLAANMQILYNENKELRGLIDLKTVADARVSKTSGGGSGAKLAEMRRKYDELLRSMSRLHAANSDLSKKLRIVEKERSDRDLVIVSLEEEINALRAKKDGKDVDLPKIIKLQEQIARYDKELREVRLGGPSEVQEVSFWRSKCAENDNTVLVLGERVAELEAVNLQLKDELASSHYAVEQLMLQNSSLIEAKSIPSSLRRSMSRQAADAKASMTRTDGEAAAASSPMPLLNNYDTRLVHEIKERKIVNDLLKLVLAENKQLRSLKLTNSLYNTKDLKCFTRRWLDANVADKIGHQDLSFHHDDGFGGSEDAGLSDEAILQAGIVKRGPDYGYLDEYESKAMQEATEHIEHLVLGWRLLKHDRHSLVPKGCTLIADLSTKSLVYAPEKKNVFSVSEALKERKRRIGFSDINQIIKGVRSSNVSHKNKSYAPRILSIVFDEEQRALILELKSEDERDILYNTLISIVGRTNAKFEVEANKILSSIGEDERFFHVVKTKSVLSAMPLAGIGLSPINGESLVRTRQFEGEPFETQSPILANARRATIVSPPIRGANPFRTVSFAGVDGDVRRSFVGGQADNPNPNPGLNSEADTAPTSTATVSVKDELEPSPEELNPTRSLYDSLMSTVVDDARTSTVTERDELSSVSDDMDIRLPMPASAPSKAANSKGSVKKRATPKPSAKSSAPVDDDMPL
jgi:hypothetical protein